MGKQRVWLAAIAVACACGPTTVVEDGSGEGGSDTSGGSEGGTSTVGTTIGTTVGEATGTTVGTTTLDTSGSTGACGMTEDDGSPGGEFDVGPLAPACDLFTQDCDPGEKCVPDWFATRVCVPVAPDPIPDGEPCETGSDDPCGPLSWCGLEDSDGNGTCVPLCTGTPADPLCPPDTICVIDDEQIVAFCQRPCDPFGDAPCPGRTSCQPTAQGFGCIEEGGHDRGGPCLEDDSCADGLVCRSATEVADCCHDACCTTLCDASHPCDAGACQPIEGVPGPDGLGFCG